MAQKRARRVRENDEYREMMTRMVRAHGRRVIEGGNIEDLAHLRDLRDQIDTAMGEVARAVQASGRSWSEIGGALGMTKQSAHQRFGK